MSDNTLYIMHILLFGTKAWLILMLIPIAQKYYKYIPILIFSIIFVVFETWFSYNYFNNVVLYYYETIAIMDEILFTTWFIFYIIKEVQNGKR